MSQIVSANLYEKLTNNVIRCCICPRLCVLSPQQHGICWSHFNQEGQLHSMTYGYVTKPRLDNIEKKPLYHFLPGTKTLSIGSVGCNLKCSFCQNSQISFANSLEYLEADYTPKMIVDLAKKNGCQSVSFTYNEPIAGLEFVIDTAKSCRAAGLHTIAVTAGYISDLVRPYFFKYMSAVNLDIKAFRDSFYKEYCNVQLLTVLDTFIYLQNETTCWTEVCNLLIPGVNDSSSEIAELSAWIFTNGGSHIPLHFNAFYPQHRLKNLKSTPIESLIYAKTIANQIGLVNVYCGNTGYSEVSTTYCYQCGKKLIERQGFAVMSNQAKKGICPDCKAALAGVF